MNKIDKINEKVDRFVVKMTIIIGIVVTIVFWFL